MGAVTYADDLLLIAPNRAAMEIMLKECEDFAEESNIQFSTDPDPQKSKSKLIHMVGKSKRVSKPAPLFLCGYQLPWVEHASYLGHELHESGTLEYDAKLKRAQFINQSLEVRETFSFASPVEILRALNIYLGSHYEAICWDLESLCMGMEF